MLHNIILDAFFKGSMVKILSKEHKIIGYCRNNNGGVPDNFHNYFESNFQVRFRIHCFPFDGLMIPSLIITDNLQTILTD